jgi:hypothetical protein
VSNRVLGPELILTLVGIQVVAKSKYWYFIKQFKRVKRANGEIVAVNEVSGADRCNSQPQMPHAWLRACMPAYLPRQPCAQTLYSFSDALCAGGWAWHRPYAAACM